MWGSALPPEGTKVAFLQMLSSLSKILGLVVKRYFGFAANLIEDCVWKVELALKSQTCILPRLVV